MSAYELDINKIPMATPSFSKSIKTLERIWTLSDIMVGGKPQDSGHKPEVQTENLISKPVHTIAMAFQQLPLNVEVPQHNWSNESSILRQVEW